MSTDSLAFAEHCADIQGAEIRGQGRGPVLNITNGDNQNEQM